MAEVNWLNKLTISKRQKVPEGAPIPDPVFTTYPLAVDFDHVYYETEETEIVNNETITHTYWWTLKDFFNKIQNFFKQRMFMKYSIEKNNNGEDTVSVNSTIMEWYCVSGNGIDSRIGV